MEAEFHRTRDAQFSAGEMWTLSNLPVLGTNQISVTNLTSEVFGTKFELFAFAGPGSYTITNGVPAPPGTVLSTNFTSGGRGGDGANQWAYHGVGKISGPRSGQFDLKYVQHFLMVKEGVFASDITVLVRGRDDQGRSIGIQRRDQNDRPRWAFRAFDFGDCTIIALSPRADAQCMDLDFIWERGRKVEFLVAPPLEK